MKSVRWPFRIFNRLKHQQRLVQSFSQVNRASACAPQIGYDLGLANARAIGANGSAANNQTNIYQTNNVAEGRSKFKGYDGALSGLNHQLGVSEWNCSSGLGVLSGHDRCTLSLKARFGRSCRAFVNAWRAL